MAALFFVWGLVLCGGYQTGHRFRSFGSRIGSFLPKATSQATFFAFLVAKMVARVCEVRGCSRSSSVLAEIATANSTNCHLVVLAVAF